MDTLSYRALVARMATDEAFAAEVLANPDGVGERHGLAAPEIASLRALSPAPAVAAPARLTTRLSKSGVFFGGDALPDGADYLDRTAHDPLATVIPGSAFAGIPAEFAEPEVAIDALPVEPAEVVPSEYGGIEDAVVMSPSDSDSGTDDASMPEVVESSLTTAASDQPLADQLVQAPQTEPFGSFGNEPVQSWDGVGVLALAAGFSGDSEAAERFTPVDGHVEPDGTVVLEYPWGEAREDAMGRLVSVTGSGIEFFDLPWDSRVSDQRVEIHYAEDGTETRTWDDADGHHSAVRYPDGRWVDTATGPDGVRTISTYERGAHGSYGITDRVTEIPRQPTTVEMLYESGELGDLDELATSEPPEIPVDLVVPLTEPRVEVAEDRTTYYEADGSYRVEYADGREERFDASGRKVFYAGRNVDIPWHPDIGAERFEMTYHPDGSCTVTWDDEAGQHSARLRQDGQWTETVTAPDGTRTVTVYERPWDGPSNDYRVFAVSRFDADGSPLATDRSWSDGSGVHRDGE